jgi:hypothetical protein
MFYLLLEPIVTKFDQYLVVNGYFLNFSASVLTSDCPSQVLDAQLHTFKLF